MSGVERALRSATVRTAVAPVNAEPRISSPMTTQQLAGHHVDVLEESADGDWVRVRGADDYQGWMHTGYLARVPEGRSRQSRHVPRVSLGCVAETAAGDRRALPLRALLAPEEILKSGEAVEGTRMADRFPPDAGAVVQTALRLFSGASYLWGGVTPWGADCSGFAQSVFAMHGVPLPRDAWQQSETGVEAPGAPADLRQADLAFFSDRDDRRVTHVAIALGDGRLVHMALGRGGFAVERLDDAADQYTARLARRFIGARRVLPVL